MFVTSTQSTQPFFVFSNNANKTTHLIMLTFTAASNTNCALTVYLVAHIIMQNIATTRTHTHVAYTLVGFAMQIRHFILLSVCFWSQWIMLIFMLATFTTTAYVPFSF